MPRDNQGETRRDIVYRSRLPREEAAAIANYILGESDEITPVDGRLTNKQREDLAATIRAFVFNSGLLQKDIGQIDDQMYLFAVTEVVGALRGLDAEERSKQRVRGYLHEYLFPPSPNAG